MENPFSPRLSSTQGQRFGRSVSIDQAAELLNVSRRTIYYRIRGGRLKTIRTMCGSRRVLVHSLHQESSQRTLTHPASTYRSLGNAPSRLP